MKEIFIESNKQYQNLILSSEQHYPKYHQSTRYIKIGLQNLNYTVKLGNYNNVPFESNLGINEDNSQEVTLKANENKLLSYILIENLQKEEGSFIIVKHGWSLTSEFVLELSSIYDENVWKIQFQEISLDND